jgi:hypothetical protein
LFFPALRQSRFLPTCTVAVALFAAEDMDVVQEWSTSSPGLRTNLKKLKLDEQNDEQIAAY